MFSKYFGVGGPQNASQGHKSKVSGLILLNNHSIDVSIVERYATISYLFDFENTKKYGSNELTFEITINPDAFISSFTADIDGELFVGETKERKVAKKQYTVAKSKDENAILISQVDKDIPNLFRIQTNIDSESEISLKITIEQYLKKTFNFNQLNVEIIRDFNKSTISQNYPHILLNVNIRDKRGIYDVTLPSNIDTIQMNEKTMDKSNKCYQMKGKLMHKQSSITEFMLKYKVKGEQNESSILYDKQSHTFCHIINDIITDSLLDDKDACEGHDDKIQGDILIPRRVVFLIDQSYSMHGVKWTNTITATVQTLNQLRPNHDRYSIIFFDDNMQQFTYNKMVLATDENIRKAMSFVQNKSLGGATDINTPLLHGIQIIKNDIRILNGQQSALINIKSDEADELSELLQMMEVEPDSQPQNTSSINDSGDAPPKMDTVSTDKAPYNFYMNQIILLTDGEPNSGVTNTSKILLNVAQANNLKNLDPYSNKISIFSFGVGTDRNDSSWTTDLNHSFLKLLSVNNQGIYKRIKETHCDTQLAEHYKILATPILNNIAIQYDAYHVNNLTNTSFNSLFHGNDIIVCGCIADKALDNLDSIQVTISAITGKSIKHNDKYMTKPIHINKQIEIDIPQGNEEKDGNNTERIWAYLKLQQYAKQKLIHNDMIEMDDEEEKQRDALPLALAMKHKFVTPWTSMIVVKEKKGNKKRKKKKKKKVKKPNDPLQTLRTRVEECEKKETHLEKQIVSCTKNAKAKSKQRDKAGALLELKKKKQFENQMQYIQGLKLNMETQIMVLQDAHLNAETISAMKTSASAMKCTVKESDLDKADELMGDVNEAMDQVNEMNEAMSQPLGVMMDDDELEAELAELEELEADELLSDMPFAHTEYGDDTDLAGLEGGAIDDTCHFDGMFLKEAVIDSHVAPPTLYSNKQDGFENFTFVPKGSEEKKEDMCDDDSKKEEKMKVFEAYDDGDIRITFECVASSKASGMCHILAVFYNKSADEITDFKFVVKVDAHIVLAMKAANGTKLLATSQNSITQQFELINTKYGEEPFVIEVEISFIKNAKEIVLKSLVKIPDYFCIN